MARERSRSRSVHDKVPENDTLLAASDHELKEAITLAHVLEIDRKPAASWLRKVRTASREQLQRMIVHHRVSPRHLHDVRREREWRADSRATEKREREAEKRARATQKEDFLKKLREGDILVSRYIEYSFFRVTNVSKTCIMGVQLQCRKENERIWDPIYGSTKWEVVPCKDLPPIDKKPRRISTEASVYDPDKSYTDSNDHGR